MSNAIIKINGATNVRIIGNSVRSDQPVTLVEGYSENLTIQDNRLISGAVGLTEHLVALRARLSSQELLALVKILRDTKEKDRPNVVRGGRWASYFEKVADAALPEIFRKLLGS